MKAQTQARGRRTRPDLAPIGLLVISLLIGLPERASAYTDPGSGALLWQSLIAALAGIGFYWRRFLMARRAKSDEQAERETGKR